MRSTWEAILSCKVAFCTIQMQLVPYDFCELDKNRLEFGEAFCYLINIIQFSTYFVIYRPKKTVIDPFIYTQSSWVHFSFRFIWKTTQTGYQYCVWKNTYKYIYIYNICTAFVQKHLPIIKQKSSFMAVIFLKWFFDRKALL